MKRLTCAERDAILLDPNTGRVAEKWGIEASLTDLGGEFGDPRIETVWGYEQLRIRDVRHPAVGGGPDVASCEHYEWVEEPRND